MYQNLSAGNLQVLYINEEVKWVERIGRRVLVFILFLRCFNLIDDKNSREDKNVFQWQQKSRYRLQSVLCFPDPIRHTVLTVIMWKILQQ